MGMTGGSGPLPGEGKRETPADIAEEMAEEDRIDSMCADFLLANTRKDLEQQGCKFTKKGEFGIRIASDNICTIYEPKVPGGKDYREKYRGPKDKAPPRYQGLIQAYQRSQPSTPPPEGDLEKGLQDNSDRPKPGEPGSISNP